MKTTLITGADSAMFDLLWGLVRSVRECPEGRDLDVAILDLGLDPPQREQLAPLVTQFVSARWEVDFPGRDDCPRWYQAMYCRPFFPRYFPDYELLIWIDADAWLCDGRALALLREAAVIDALAIVPEIDRTYSHCYGLRPVVRENLRQSYLMSFGPGAAGQYPTLPVFNCGVFAMRCELPYWSIWSELLAQALARGAAPLLEQCALNVAAYTRRIPVYCLPSWCNWNVAHSVPRLDLESRTLHSPLLPHEPISICHLTDIKRQPVQLPCSDGTVRQMPLTYESVREAEPPPPLAG